MRLTGRCLCGQVTYAFEGEPESMKYCHCDTCRRVTGSAFNIGVGVPRDQLVTEGETRTHVHTNGSTRVFCPTCGTPLWTVGRKSVWIRAGTLDSSEGLEPTSQVWTGLAVPWAQIPADIPSFPQEGPRTDGGVKGP